MKVFNPEDLSPESLAKAGMPAELIAFLTALGALDEKRLCDCPPGVCLGNSEIHDGPTGAILNDIFDPDMVRDSGDENDVEDEEDDDFDFDVDFEPDFDLDSAMTAEDRVRAVAQLGRVIEDLVVLVGLHAELLKKLVA